MLKHSLCCDYIDTTRKRERSYISLGGLVMARPVSQTRGIEVGKNLNWSISLPGEEKLLVWGCSLWGSFCRIDQLEQCSHPWRTCRGAAGVRLRKLPLRPRKLGCLWGGRRLFAAEFSLHAGRQQEAHEVLLLPTTWVTSVQGLVAAQRPELPSPSSFQTSFTTLRLATVSAILTSLGNGGFYSKGLFVTLCNRVKHFNSWPNLCFRLGCVPGKRLFLEVRGPGEPRMHLKVRDDVLLEVKMTLGVFDIPNSYRYNILQNSIYRLIDMSYRYIKHP